MAVERPRRGTPVPEYRVSWVMGGRWIAASGATPRKAVANARRIRRDYFLAGRSPGWMTLHEQLIWTRMARRLGFA